MTDEFDDQAFRDAIGARSGGPVHTSDARQTIVARATRTRNLRSAAVGGTATFVLIVGLVLFPTIGDTPGRPADQPAAPVATSPKLTASPATTVRPTETTSMSPTTTITPTPTTTIAPATTGPTDAATTAPSAAASTTLSSAPSPQPTPAPTTEPTSTSPPATSPSTTTTPPTIPTTSTPDPSDPPFNRQYDSLGGSITVDWDGSALTLVATAANDGYEIEIEDQSADRVRVRFRGGDDDSRIEVRVRDGKVEHTIS